MEGQCKHKGCVAKAGFMVKGYCLYHYHVNLSENKKKKEKSTFRRYPKKRNAELDAFFKRATKGGGHSEESGVFIPNLKRMNIAHVLPKGIFPSVSCDDTNYIILTLDEHAKFDGLVDANKIDALRLEMPNTYEIFIRRLGYLLDKVDETNKVKYRFYKEIFDKYKNIEP